MGVLSTGFLFVQISEVSLVRMTWLSSCLLPCKCGDSNACLLAVQPQGQGYKAFATTSTTIPSKQTNATDHASDPKTWQWRPFFDSTESIFSANVFAQATMTSAEYEINVQLPLQTILTPYSNPEQKPLLNISFNTHCPTCCSICVELFLLASRKSWSVTTQRKGLRVLQKQKFIQKSY